MTPSLHLPIASTQKSMIKTPNWSPNSTPELNAKIWNLETKLKITLQSTRWKLTT